MKDVVIDNLSKNKYEIRYEDPLDKFTKSLEVELSPHYQPLVGDLLRLRGTDGVYLFEIKSREYEELNRPDYPNVRVLYLNCKLINYDKHGF